MTCSAQGNTYAVVVFDRDTSGAIRTLGRALLTAQSGPIWSVKDIRADAGGAIGVRVGDVFAIGSGMTQLSAEW